MWRYGDGGDGPELHRSSFGVKVELLKIQKKDWRTKSKVVGLNTLFQMIWTYDSVGCLMKLMMMM